jgi:AraC-like DNA-binding protein/quercetin dioxygenase-like cupin family protein
MTEPTGSEPPASASGPTASASAPATRPTAIVLERFPMPRGGGFEEHTHDVHQLAWVREGILMVTIGERHWVLPPSLALWIPAGIAHTSTAVREEATMQGIYLPRAVQQHWTEPTVVTMSGLLRELVDYLCSVDLRPGARHAAEALVPELLEPSATLTIEVPLPSDPRAMRIAEALLADPGDPRDLGDWGHAVGASVRTLSRVFPAQTGMGFAQWRSRMRLRASLAHLAAGETVSTTAALVGFASTSAFIAAFGRLTGMTPGAYFASISGEQH